MKFNLFKYDKYSVTRENLLFLKVQITYTKSSLNAIDMFLETVTVSEMTDNETNFTTG